MMAGERGPRLEADQTAYRIGQAAIQARFDLDHGLPDDLT
jgi:hypothetical protein